VGQVRARINGGVGETIVIIPAGMAARIEATTGLGQVQVIGNYQREGKISTTAGYDSATNRVDLVVSGGIGSITVRQESGR
jgi:predicted membrane protein